MIAGLPTQNISPGPQTRKTGCKAHTGMAIVADFLGVVPTPAQVRDWIVDAIYFGWMTKELLVEKPHYWMKYVGAMMGTRIECDEVYRGPAYANKLDQYKDCLIETEVEITEGTHFLIQKYNYETKTFDEVYNPYPGCHGKGVVSIRVWEVKKL
jgi:hypothetical protein